MCLVCPVNMRYLEAVLIYIYYVPEQLLLCTMHDLELKEGIMASHIYSHAVPAMKSVKNDICSLLVYRFGLCPFNEAGYGIRV